MNKNNKFTNEELGRITFIIDNILKVENFEELNTLYNDNLTLVDLRNAKMHLRTRISIFSNLKKHYFYMSDYEKYEEYKKLIRECKDLIKVINKINDNFIEDIHKQNNDLDEAAELTKLENRKHLVVNNILMLDYYFQDSDKEIFQKYLDSTSYDEKMRYLMDLRERYLAATFFLYRSKKDVMEQCYKIVAKENKLGSKLEKNKKAFKLLLEQDIYSDYKREINLIKMQYNKSKIFLKNIERLISFENAIYNSSIPKKNYEEDETDYNELLRDKYPDCKELVDRLNNIRSGRYSRKYGTSISSFIPKDLEHLFSSLKELDYEILMDVSLLGIDVVKNKLKTLKKGQNEYDDAERIFLKKLVKRFEDLKPFLPFDEMIDTSVYYEIIDSLAYNDNNYTYIEKLIKQIDGCKNARNKEGKHIILKLLDNFIMNYKLKLINQRFLYIEPDFYKEIIKLFYENNVELTDSEQEEIKKRLVEFEEYCKERKYASLSDVSQDINELRNESVKARKDYDKDKLEQEEKFLDFYIDNTVDYYRRRNYPIYYDSENSSVFMLKNVDNVAFSVGHNDNGVINFGIHLLDTSKIVSEDSEIIKAALSGGAVLPKLDKNRLYPVMSFTYSLIDGHKISNMRFNPGIIKIDKTYTENDLKNYRDKLDLKELAMIISQMQEKDENVDIHSIEGLKNVIFDNLGQDLKRRFEISHIPFIYEKVLENSEDLIRENHNAVCDKLIEIPKKEAYQIFAILDKAVDKYYVPDITNTANINFDTSSFLGYYLVNILNKIQNGKYDIDKEAEIIDGYLNKLNSNRRYLPTSVVRRNQNKLKKVVKQYKKKR